MSELRERAQAYLELASKATEGPWAWQKKPLGVDLVCRSSDEEIRGLVILPCDYVYELDASFIAASRTEGVWAAQKLLEALDVLEEISNMRASGYASDAIFKALAFLNGDSRG